MIINALSNLAIFPDFFFKGKDWIWADDTFPEYDSEMLGWLSPCGERASQIRKQKVKSIVGSEFIGQCNSSAQRRPDFGIYITQTVLEPLCLVLSVVDAFILPLAPIRRNFTAAFWIITRESRSLLFHLITTMEYRTLRIFWGYLFHKLSAYLNTKCLTSTKVTTY